MNPYSSQALSRFAFASRTSNAPAPLFYSATDDFREEDDHVEHDREIADHLRLQRSRRQFGGSNLSESSEVDDDMEKRSDHTIDGGSVENDAPGYGLGRGIKSSWIGDRPDNRGRSRIISKLDHEERDESVPLSESSAPSSKGNDKLVDVELASTIKGSIEELDPNEAFSDMDDRPASYQSFRNMPKRKRGRSPLRTTLPIPQETEEDLLLEHPREMSPDRESVSQEEVAVNVPPPPRHNIFFAELFLITQCAIVGIYLISLLQDSPDRKTPLGDTIYTVLHSSFRLIGIYSLVSVVVGLLWLSLLRTFARPLIMLIMVAVPVISFSFFLYPLIASFKGPSHGSGIQDKAMRWMSFGPLLFFLFWMYTVWKGRHSLNKATAMLEFSSDILRSQSPLLLVGIGTLACVILWSWIWMSMFAHLFLGGHFNKDKRWIIDPSSWWLGAAFFLDYFWTLGVIAGVQRSTTAATVSQWYFHRKTVPTPAPRMVVYASLKHATTTMAGSICLSTLLSLLVRLPLIVLPRRIAGIINMCAYNLVPTPIAALTNPLTLTYASIHGLSLSPAARGLSNMTFISPASPTTTLGPRSFAPSQGRQSIMSYRLAKLLLHAIRWVITLALGFGGWVSAARMLQIGNEGVKGSVYAYVVGLISAAIGWGALGAMEGVLGGILDAVLICWSSEVGPDGRGQARYCVEADKLFADEIAGGTQGRYDV